MTFTATAAYPYLNAEGRPRGLRGQLREIVAAAGSVADWTTMTVEGPTEAAGAHRRAWYEWSATVEQVM